MTKIATDIEQNKILKDILPLDSHDMYYEAKNGDLDSEFDLFVGQNIAILKNLFSYRLGYTIPAWSLAALIDLLPNFIKHRDGTYYGLSISNYHVEYSNSSLSALYSTYHSITAETTVDACYEMVIWLKENGLI